MPEHIDESITCFPWGSDINLHQGNCVLQYAHFPKSAEVSAL
jgi:hypothetical protein